MAPVKISGVSTIAKATLMRLGGTAVPITRPIAAPTIDPTSQIAIRASQLAWARSTPPGRISSPSGRMSTAATMPRRAAMTIFWAPTHAVGRGASSRSSISLVNENSITSGSAVFCSEVSTSVSAITPGRSCSPYCGPAAPISGRTRPKTNRKKIGCSSA